MICWTEGSSNGSEKKSLSPVGVLKVTYIREAGVNTGAIRKEFLSGKLHKAKIFI